MKNFEMLCGIDDKEKTIVNLDKISEIRLDKKYSNVIVLFKYGNFLSFKTDLKDLSDVMICLKFTSTAGVKFKQEIIDQYNEYKKK